MESQARERYGRAARLGERAGANEPKAAQQTFDVSRTIKGSESLIFSPVPSCRTGAIEGAEKLSIFRQVNSAT
jgi:hypothetical protein